ncbi:hypothetical protein ACVWYI_000382 [Bradyrhizobium sp. LB13.1]
MKKPAILFTSLVTSFAAALPATPALADDFPSAIFGERRSHDFRRA